MAVTVYTRLRSSFLLLATIPLIFTGLVVAGTILVREYRLSLSEREETARRVSRSVSTFFHGLREDLENSVRLREIADLNRRELTDVMESIMTQFRGVESIGFVLPTGEEVLRRSRISLVRQEDLRSWTGEAWFDAPLHQGSSHFGEMYLSPRTGEPLIPLGIPVIDLNTGEPVGVLIADIRVILIWELLREEMIGPGEEVYVTDEQGRLIAHRVSSYVLSRKTAPDSSQDSRLGWGLEGSRVLRATHPIRFNGKTFQAVAEIALFQTFRSVVLIMVVTIVIAVLSAIGALMWALREAQRIAAPLQATAETARRIRELAILGEPIPDMGSLFSSTNEPERNRIEEEVILLEVLETMVHNLGVQLEETRQALKEREILLKEVHHRVKNNLQVIASLVNLQQERIGTPGSRDIAGTIRRRVYAMALVHMQLYEADSLTRIDLEPYIRSLAHHVLSEYREGRDMQSIQVHCSAVKTAISVDQAGPLGLILGEVFSNCLQHAFHERSEGTVSISARTEDGTVTVCVEDDGTGPAGREGEDTNGGGGLGLLLVRELTSQLRGESEFTARPSGGTLFRISFPAAT